MKQVLACVFALLCVTCGQPDQPVATKVDETVLAVFDSGVVTAKELDREILNLPANQRHPDREDRVAWQQQLIEKIALDKVFLQRANEEGFAKDVRFTRRERHLRRVHVTNEYLRRHGKAEPLLSETAVRAYYDDHRDLFEQQAQRQVYHLYRRFTPDREKEALIAEMSTLRQRIVAGESLAGLAETYSESESRHRGGQLGFISRGQFSEDFDNIVFGLATGVPSEPLSTQDGVHLFLVQSAIDAKTYSLDEVRPLIVQRLILETQQRKLAELAQKLPPPEPLFVAEVDRAAWFLSIQDPTFLVLKVGSYELAAAEFSRLFSERQGGGLAQIKAPQLLNEIRDREIVFQHLGETEPDGMTRAQYEYQREQALIEMYIEELMTREVQVNSPRLQAHYQYNKMRFASPVQVHIKALRIGMGDDPVHQMARLEAACIRVGPQANPLDTLAAEFGGEIRDYGMAPIGKIQRRDPRAPFFAVRLAVGELSAPYQLDDHFVCIQLVARKEPKPQAFALVKNRVVRDYLTHNRQHIFSTLSQQVLETIQFELKERQNDSLSPAGIPTTEP